MTIFLSYYEPFAGLCNQLYLITNHIHEAYTIGTDIYIDLFNVDIFKKNRVPANEVLDIKKTNKNLNVLLGRDLLRLEKPKEFYIPKLCIYPVSSVEILKSLEFHPRILEKVPSGQFNVIHFRMDVDVVIQKNFGMETYNYFMGLCNSNPTDAKLFAERTTNQEKVFLFIDNLMKQYITFIDKIKNGNSWYICTSVGKNPVHNCMIPFLEKIIEYIGMENIYPTEVYFHERELNALVDLLVMKNAKTVIGFEGSSFSEGYAYKTSDAGKDWYFVKI